MLVDSHCHLDYLQRDGLDVGEVWSRARSLGVTHALTIGTRLSSFSSVLGIAESHANICCSVGVHPHESDDEGVSDSEILLGHCEHVKVVGIGETGLDYFYDHSDRDVQRSSFRAHIEASRVSGLPLIVHTRCADEDTIEILFDEYGRGEFGGVIHCFSTSRWLAERALELGFYISLSGIITFKNSQDLRDIVIDLPMDRILVETDSPYLAPVPYRGKSNEPGYVISTAEKLAEIKSLEFGEVCSVTSDNFFRLFSKFPHGAE